MGKYCGKSYLDMWYSVGLGSEGFVAQHLTHTWNGKRGEKEGWL